ncbi:MAG TPA: homoserine kinase [Alteraurantiacibacter sp.]
MAVYTHLSAEDLADLVHAYDVGDLVSAKGIAEGVSNSNWLIETTGSDGQGARFILTMYEFRIELSDLPFFLGLLDHLSGRGCPVPRTIHDSEGAAYRMIGSPGEAGKAVALIQFLPGVSIGRPTPAQARAVGAALAGIHLAAQDYPAVRANAMGLSEWHRLLDGCGKEGLASIDRSLPGLVETELAFLDANWPDDLPRGTVHADLFPDNVLMLDEKVSGLIDFYFACTDMLTYDIAVTHAAWCFTSAGEFLPEISSALLAGYGTVRPVSPEERAALPVLARGAAMRFISSRAYDWLNTPADAMVTRKDPMDFARRLSFYGAQGARAFNF